MPDLKNKRFLIEKKAFAQSPTGVYYKWCVYDADSSELVAEIHSEEMAEAFISLPAIIETLEKAGVDTRSIFRIRRYKKGAMESWTSGMWEWLRKVK